MLERAIERVGQAKLVNEIVVAAPHDIPCSVPIFIGDEKNVLKRYYDCASYYGANIIVRITSDCPLVMPNTIDECVHFREILNMDYVAAIEPNYPDGLDVEVFTYDTLERADAETTKDSDKEHVTPYMRSNSFNHVYLDYWEGNMDKVSVDTIQDLERVRKIWIGKQKPYWL